jgi:hypothetical protein
MSLLRSSLLPAIGSIDGWLMRNDAHLRFRPAYQLWKWTVVEPDMGIACWWRWMRS